MSQKGQIYKASVFFHEIEATVFIIVFINIPGYPPVLAGKLSVMWCI